MTDTASRNVAARGRFITVEGIEGVGKTTSLEFIRAHLAAAGHDVLVTREPGGTPTAERLRAVLLESAEPIGAQAELLLMFAARSLHVDNLIRPAVEAGQWVLCDRFTDATRAYQGAGRGLDAAWIERLADAVHAGLEPDLTLWLDAPVEVALRRAAQRRSGEADRFEREREPFFERVREGYRELAMRWPDRVRRVDAAASVEDVQHAIARILDEALPKKEKGY